MTLTLTVQNGRIVLPAELRVPDGTQVEIILPETKQVTGKKTAVSLPTFRGDGLQPGVDLNDMRSIRQLIDEGEKNSQLL